MLLASASRPLISFADSGKGCMCWNLISMFTYVIQAQFVETITIVKDLVHTEYFIAIANTCNGILGIPHNFALL